MRPELVVTSLAILLTVPAAAQRAALAQKSPARSARANRGHSRSAPDAAAIHNSAIVIDTHADTPGRFAEVERVSRQIQSEQNPDRRPVVAIPQSK
jgi:hypothetical protein